LTVTKPPVPGEEPLADGGGPVGDAAGCLVDALAADLLSVALGAVPAAQDASGADAVVGGDLLDGEHGSQAPVAPEPARGADLDHLGLEAPAVGAFVAVLW